MDRNHKICVVVLYPNRHVIDIFEKLKPLGYQVDYFFFDTIPDYRANNGWKVPENSSFLNVWSVKAIFSLLRKTRSYQAVFFQSLIFPFMFNALLQLMVQWLRGDRFIYSEGARHPGRKRFTVRLLSKVFLNSKNVQHLSIGTGAAKDYVDYGFTRWKYRKFCFCEEYNSRSGPKWTGAADDSIVLLCVGRLLKRKNFSQLLSTLRNYQGTQHLTVAICGDGEEEASLRELASDLPDNVSVHFAGHCDKATLDTYYRRADIFVLTSLYEGWGVVVNHALHFGLPLLLRSTVRSGVGYLMVEGKNGYSFTDDLSLLRGVNALATDTNLRNQMKDFSLKHNELWCMDVIVNRLDSLIEDRNVAFNEGPLTEISFNSERS